MKGARKLIVAQPGHAQAFYTAFAADARFAVQAVATSADDARAKLTLEPEAVVVEVVVFSGPKTPERCAAPFSFAQSAAAQEADVSMFFTMQGALLRKQGVAEQVAAFEGGRPISQFIQDTLKAGVKFYVCAASLELNGMMPDDLINDVDNLVGSTFLITAGLDAELVLSF